MKSQSAWSMMRRTSPRDRNAMLTTPVFRGVWAAIFTLLVFDLLCGACTGVGFTGIPRVVGGCLTLVAASLALRRLAPQLRVGACVEGSAAVAASSLSIGLLSYQCGRSGMPIQDALFNRLDEAIGFDWMAFSHFVRRHSVLNATLVLSYWSLLPQGALAALVLSVPTRLPALGRLIFASLLAGVACCIVSWLLPADSAFVSHGMLASAEWMGDLQLLRTADPVQFSVREMRGIITFPSFHAVMGVLFICGSRYYGWLRWPVTLVNLLLIVATTVIGGHYLVDVLAGIAVAAGSVTLVRRVEAWQLARTCGSEIVPRKAVA